jgi:hypothetical protein
MSTCNLAQAGFVARLADEYLDGMLTSRALARPFVDACLSKLMEVCVALNALGPYVTSCIDSDHVSSRISWKLSGFTLLFTSGLFVSCHTCYFT